MRNETERYRDIQNNCDHAVDHDRISNEEKIIR